ncbi:MAG: exodeoxyribonuclease V subunit gamma [Fibrobacter sp.]|nr:exodeoxyribonuclease V subunit gamma [Fibrobacter sp.]
MLHLKFALNLEHLADEMIEAISKEWKDPFNAPVVIFPDPKLEQWFRLRWMKKKGVLANLNKSTIDRFLFDILVGDDRKLKKLSSEMLANVIMAYLLGKDDEGKPNYELIDPKVADYLTKKVKPGEEERKIDEVRLFDLANELAGLFLEYETSRPRNFLQNEEGKLAEGLLDYWSEELLKDKGTLRDFFVKRGTDSRFETVNNESWERTLYSKVFHNVLGKSLLTRVFEKADSEPDEENKVKYLTLPFLYKACLDAKGNPQFKYKSNAPVFILGLSGMGQFYRVVLREFAKQYEVHAYIQNPCMEFWEDLDTRAIAPKIQVTHIGDKILETEDSVSENENDLLRKWGKSGRDNIKLWCLADDYSSCDFKESERLKLLDEKMEQPKDLLHAVQYLVANRKNKFDDAALFKKEAEDDSITVTAAPSKLREVEALHSSICKLLLKGVHSNDILVVSPNLQEYSPYIYQIFDQSKNAAENGDKSIVHIPYTIVDSVSKESLVGSLIKVLFQVRKEHSISRPDFFNLVRNPVVQAARGITPEMVSVWEKWVVDMNVYRDRPSRDFEPWQWAAKRMLLARLTSTTQEIKDRVYTPYANMNSSNDVWLIKFIDAIEDLEKWTNSFDKGLAEKDSDALLEMFNSWACMKNAPDEIGGEKAAYYEVCKALNRLKYIFYAETTETIPMEIVKQSMLQAATVTEFSFGNLFVNGISFMKFAPNRIVPVKHLFFLGADVDHFPGEMSFGTLDLRRQVRPWPGDDTNVCRNRYAFLCQLMCTSEGFHVSYQNMNLAKDSEIYPSPIINDLKDFVAGFAEEPLPTVEIPLDETRSKDNLFTRRGRRYLDSISRIKAPKSEGGDLPSKSLDGNGRTDSKYPDKVSISQMKSFLNDPFQFYVNRMLRLENAEDDPTEEYVEPISLSKLDESIYLKQAVYIERNLNKDFESVDAYFNSLESQGDIPSGGFGKGVVDKIKENAANINEELKKYFPADGYECGSIELNVNVSVDNRPTFILQGNVPLVFKSKENGGECVIVELSSSKVKNKHYLSPYIGALGLLASGRMSKVTLFVSTGANGKADSYEKFACELEATQDSAKDTLCSIYENAFVKMSKKVLPVDIVCDELQSLENLKQKLDQENGSPWSYFAGKDLFVNNLEKCSGYSVSNFKKEWSDACKLQKKLLGDLVKMFEKEGAQDERYERTATL